MILYLRGLDVTIVLCNELIVEDIYCAFLSETNLGQFNSFIVFWCIKCTIDSRTELKFNWQTFWVESRHKYPLSLRHRIVYKIGMKRLHFLFPMALGRHYQLFQLRIYIAIAKFSRNGSFK